jgi:hypothetical protein
MFGHNNSGSSLFSKGSGGLTNRGSTGPLQLSLVPSEGFSGNGMATIGTDNTFSLIAHLPPPHTFSPYSPAVYAAYLVDSKGQHGFYAGTLKAAGSGMYQASFRSPVPLVHYNRVVVSLESPQGIGQAPQGPIVMKVKEGIWDNLGPVKKIGGDMWGKMKGFVGSRINGNKAPGAGEPQPVPTAPPPPPPQSPAPQSPPPQAYSSQPYAQQGGYQQANPGTYQPGYQGGNYQYNSYPKGRGLYPQGGYQPRQQYNYAPPPQPNTQVAPPKPAYIQPVTPNTPVQQVPAAGQPQPPNDSVSQ